jgi:hypothetical protein
MTKTELESKHIAELHALAAEAEVPRYRMLRREELIEQRRFVPTETLVLANERAFVASPPRAGRTGAPPARARRGLLPRGGFVREGAPRP